MVLWAEAAGNLTSGEAEGNPPLGSLPPGWLREVGQIFLRRKMECESCLPGRAQTSQRTTQWDLPHGWYSDVDLESEYVYYYTADGHWQWDFPSQAEWSLPIPYDCDARVVFCSIGRVLGRDAMPEDEVLTSGGYQLTLADLCELEDESSRDIFPIKINVRKESMLLQQESTLQDEEQNQGEMWIYQPPSWAAGEHLVSRTLPSLLDGQPTAFSIEPMQTFQVHEVKSDSGVMFLRLSGERGWVHARLPNGSTICVRVKTPALPITTSMTLLPRSNYLQTSDTVTYNSGEVEEANGAQMCSLAGCCSSG